MICSPADICLHQQTRELLCYTICSRLHQLPLPCREITTSQKQKSQTLEHTHSQHGGVERQNRNSFQIQLCTGVEGEIHHCKVLN